MIKHALKCTKCGHIQEWHHSARFYNSFNTFLCGNCGAHSGCWEDTRLKIISIAVWWKPWTWRRYRKQELLKGEIK